MEHYDGVSEGDDATPRRASSGQDPNAHPVRPASMLVATAVLSVVTVALAFLGLWVYAAFAAVLAATVGALTVAAVRLGGKPS